MAPPCLSRLLLIFLVGLTNVMAHPVNKDDPTVLGSVDVKGSPDLKWKPKSEEHDHHKTQVLHGHEKSTTVIYQKVTVTSHDKDVSKDKPGKNGQEESAKTKHPKEPSSKHDKNLGATPKHKDTKRHEHNKHEDEKVKDKHKPTVYDDASANWRPNRTLANGNKTSETIKYWKGDSTNKIKDRYKERVEKYNVHSNATKNIIYCNDQKNVFEVIAEKKKQEELKNKVPRNDKQEAVKYGKPLSLDNDSATQPEEFDLTTVTKKQWEDLDHDRESLRKLDKAEKEFQKQAKKDREGAEKTFIEALRQALAHSDKKALEWKRRHPGKTRKPGPHSKLIARLIAQSEKFDKAELASTGKKGVEKKKTIGKRCIPMWVYLTVELVKMKKMKKEKKKLERLLTGQTLPAASKAGKPAKRGSWMPPSPLTEEQIAGIKAAIEKAENEKKLNPTKSLLKDSQLNSTELKEAQDKKKNQETIHIAPGKTEHLDKAKLSIKTEETSEKTKESVKSDKTPHGEKDKEINTDSKAESQKDLKSSKDKLSKRCIPLPLPIPVPVPVPVPANTDSKAESSKDKLSKRFISDEGEKSLEARWPLRPPFPHKKRLTAKERELLVILKYLKMTNPRLAKGFEKTLEERYPHLVGRV